MSYKVFRASGFAGMVVRAKIGGSNPLGDIAMEQVAIHELRLHLDAASATAENLVFKQDSAIGPAFDMVYATKAMNAVQDYNYIPTLPHVISVNDEICVDWANSNGRTWGLEIIYSAV
jgi:hypothetical protein